MNQYPLPRIAVIYATAQGSTREIAEYIAADLAARGATVEVADVEHAPDLSRFDTVILGSAVHNRALLPEAAEYLRSHRQELLAREVWMFSVGLGPALRGPIGRRVGTAVPKRIALARDLAGAHEYRAFAGHYERAGVSWSARTIYRLLGGTRYGDLRDWTAVSLWSASIARALKLPQPAAIPTHP
ncbi:flavodoxin domain-containing protein [Nocardia inohanensis]|uniref:flavodoxin domain-containing protein n=1 Tax=Nocardia inohanensis TaxID=209246 RepID=UPI00082FFFA9|nr:flavodoxin domain-containing protein [Nocardia inohanensis]